MTDLTVFEGGPPIVITLDHHEGDALAESGVVDAVRLGGGEWAVSATTKVGVATIGDLTIWIRPKVEIARLLFLLGYARNPGWREDTVAMAAVDDLVPALAEAFVEQTERALERGVLQGYAEVDDSLTVLRGRLREHDQLRQRFGIAVPLLVRFDEHTVDIAENQLLRGAAEILLRLPRVPAGVRTRLRHLRLVLAEVTPPPRGAPLPVWTPHRLNERYHVALWLADLILRGNAVDAAPGGLRVGGFLVDMAKVYEDFLTTALDEALVPHGGWSVAQDRQLFDIGGDVEIRPDLVWYVDGQPAAVVDAKYKAEKPAGFPNADLYQMLAYCTTLQLSEGHLVYAKGNAESATHEVRHAGITIHTHTLDLAEAPPALLAQVDRLAQRIAGTAPVALRAGA